MKLTGLIRTITFEDPKSGYRVVKMQDEKSKEILTITGYNTSVVAGGCYEVEGEWGEHTVHGKFFKAVKWEEKLPESLEGIEAYLGLGLITGINKVLAKRIVSHFGMDTLSVIENDPDRLYEVEKIGIKRIQAIKEGWDKHGTLRRLMAFLHDYEMDQYAERIYKRYGESSINLIKDNPYRMAEEIKGITFKCTDQMALSIGIACDDARRLSAGVKEAMSRSVNAGNVYEERDTLLLKTERLLGVSASIISDELDAMIQRKELIHENEITAFDKDGNVIDAVYSPDLYEAENEVAYRIRTLLHTPPLEGDVLYKKLKKAIEKGSTHPRLNLAYFGIPEQEDGDHDAAFQCLSTSTVTIITGGPGVGKTTVMKEGLKIYKRANLSVCLVAPTGKAAKRLSEATGVNASTIHRLLGYNGEGYIHDETNPIEADVLIMDEASMTDIRLFASLLKAMRPTTRLVIIGDRDQLPSVGPGRVLGDLIDSGNIPVARLTHVHRQGDGNGIVDAARKINMGEMPDFENNNDVEFIECEEDEAEDVIVDLVTNVIPARDGISADDIQVLAPMKKYVAGTVELNRRLQAALNGYGEAIKHGMYEYRAGDKVMQICNDYDKGVMNGECGIIECIWEDGNGMTVDFGDGAVWYKKIELDEIQLAYSQTIHKSQGSEYDTVVIPIFLFQKIMLQRRSLYTAITRARRKVIIVGSREALEYAIKHDTAAKRKSLLKERLSSL